MLRPEGIGRGGQNSQDHHKPMRYAMGRHRRANRVEKFGYGEAPYCGIATILPCSQHPDGKQVDSLNDADANGKPCREMKAPHDTKAGPGP